MKIGLVGSGNMARALAIGWGEPLLCTDAGSGRAAALAAELGGEVVGSNRELAERADVIVLCHKPYQLEAVAREIGSGARAVASVLGGTSLAALTAAYPGTPVVRTMPNTPVEVRRGVVAYAAAPDVPAELDAALRELFGRVGRVVVLPEDQLELATGVMGVAPAYVATVVEAMVDAGVKHGLPAARAAELVVETFAGTAALLEAKGYDTLAVRRAVTSPRGSTARGLAALEAAGLRAAFLDAMAAVVDGGR